MNKPKQVKNQIRIDDEYVSFTAQCMKCGGEVSIGTKIGYGSNQTGVFGSVDIKCNERDCDNAEVIWQS